MSIRYGKKYTKEIFWYEVSSDVMPGRKPTLSANQIWVMLAAEHLIQGVGALTFIFSEKVGS